jgi:hypothetical protein
MSYVTRILTQLPFGHIIGSPMKAAIEAQALAARSTLEFIQTVGFTEQNDSALNSTQSGGAGSTQLAPSSDFGSIRTITFTYTTQDVNGQPQTANLTVPILTVVPIPYLRIESMTIDFMVKMTEEYKRTTDSNTSIENTNTLGVKGFWTSAAANFNASLSAKHSSSAQTSSRYSTEATMNIHVQVVQDSIPAGMAKVLQILENAVTNTQ